MGSYIGTVAADLKFQLWSEDRSQAYNSGRRFRLAASIPSTPRVPFSSLDFKTVDYVYTYLALIDRQGLLSIYEPNSPDDLKEWTLLDQLHVCLPAPSRGDETSFKVQWNHNLSTVAYGNMLSNDKKQLSLVVTSLNEVKVYCSRPETDTPVSGLESSGASHRITFHECFRLPTHPALVRDVAWSSWNTRGYDRIATACKDGSVRVYDLATIPSPGSDSNGVSSRALSNNHRGSRSRPAQQSSLTSAITGRPNTSSNNASSPRSADLPWAFKIQHLTELPAHGDAWIVTWNGMGTILMSAGSDGVTKIWRKSVQSGQWMLFADQAVDFDAETGEEE